MKAVAVRRMALDAREADVDVGGRMSHIQGMKAAVSISQDSSDADLSADAIELVHRSQDIHPFYCLPRHHRCGGFPKLLPDPDGESLPQPHWIHPQDPISTSLRSTIYLHRDLVSHTRSRFR